MTINAFRHVRKLIQELGDLGIGASVTETGGGCRALLVIYSSDGSHLLITDGDASLPSECEDSLIGDYPHASNGEPERMIEVPAGSPRELAVAVLRYLQTGE